jgi:hypothetical protein
MRDLTNGKLEAALAYAKELQDTSLQGCLDRLKKVEEYNDERGKPTEHTISVDFAPLSFYFERHNTINGEYYGNGGIIFHGKHDNGGNGSAPTFSVNLTPTSGWQIHT